jgi:hypothetical protein
MMSTTGTRTFECDSASLLLLLLLLVSELGPATKGLFLSDLGALLSFITTLTGDVEGLKTYSFLFFLYSRFLRALAAILLAFFLLDVLQSLLVRFFPLGFAMILI